MDAADRQEAQAFRGSRLQSQLPSDPPECGARSQELQGLCVRQEEGDQEGSDGGTLPPEETALFPVSLSRAGHRPRGPGRCPPGLSLIHSVFLSPELEPHTSPSALHLQLLSFSADTLLLRRGS